LSIRTKFEQALNAVNQDSRSVMARDPALFCQLLEIFSVGFTYGMQHELQMLSIDRVHRQKWNEAIQEEIRSIWRQTDGMKKILEFDPWKQ
jgi:hypothetical protein